MNRKFTLFDTDDINTLMNKACAILLLSVLAFTSSCQKDPVEISDKTYLISSITTNYPSGTSEMKFPYDGNNRITDMAFNGGTNKYTYNSAGKLSKMTVTLDGVGLHHTVEYEYSASAIVLKLTENVIGRVTVYNAELTAGQVTKLTIDAKNGYAYTYDAKGNLLTYNELSDGKLYERATYIYDDKKSPFSMVSGFDPYLFFDTFIQIYSTANNRVGTKTTANHSTVYTYNEDGFPTSAVVNQTNGTVANVTYKYIVK